MSGKNDIRKAYEAILNGDFEEAIQWFVRAIEHEPGNAEYHYKISITYARSDRLDKALYHAASACKLRPDQHEYRYHFQRLRARQLAARAHQILETKQVSVDAALDLLQDAVKLDPLCEEAWILKAVAHAELGKIDIAVQTVHKALELNPHNELALRLLQTYQKKINPYTH